MILIVDIQMKLNENIQSHLLIGVEMIAAPFASIEVLLVEDEVGLAGALQTDLLTLQYTPSVAHSAVKALELTDRRNFNLLVSDIRLGNTDGLQLGRQLRSKDACLALLFMTGKPEAKGQKMAMEMGGAQYLSKPVSIADFSENLAMAARWNIAQLINRCAAHYIASKHMDPKSLPVKLQQAKVILKNTVMNKRDVASLRDYAYARDPQSTELFNELETQIGQHLGV